MRTGPRPLSVHIGMAATGWPHNIEPAGTEIQQHVAQNMSEMLLGIQKYHLHPYKPNRPELEHIWSKGQTKLGVLKGKDNHPEWPQLLIIPSLVNKAYIMNLTENRSLMNFFYDRKIYPYLLDWGSLIAEDRAITMESILREKLIAAAEFIQKETQKAPHALGYCMGGTLLIAAENLQPEAFKSLLLLAAPWDFHAGTQTLLNRVKFWAPLAQPHIEARKALPVDWTQTLFAMLDPSLSAKKFAKFYNMDSESEEARLFVSVEDWLNDGVDLPESIANICINEWFLDNKTVRDLWKVGGHIISASNIQTPCISICSSRDRLIERETSLAAHSVINSKVRRKAVDPHCGHIGMIAGKKALENVWSPMANWILQG